jgi:chitinase
MILLDQAPDFDCVATTANTLAAEGLNTTHMISIGGWGSPHPAITNDPEAVYANWKDWNENTVARNGWPGFDGLDWDLEGVNTIDDPDNTITTACMDTVGRVSQLAKADGYIVSLVPPQSYFDVTIPNFDNNLTHNYPDYMPTFYYHSWNAYAYIYSRYNSNGSTQLFDFISIQLYESYSRALYNISVLGQPAAEYLTNYIPQLYAGWKVDFSSDPSVNWPTQHVSLNPTQVVIGLANGWADPSRCLLIWPTEVGAAYNNLKAKGLQPRGFMFWDIGDEGEVPQGYSQPLYLAAGLNAFLHTRP